MSEFSCLCANATLWDPTTRAAWVSLNFCPMLMWFQVHVIMQTQLTTLSQAGACGEVEKPRQDMAFLMIVPNTNTRDDQAFGLAVVWAHPNQGHLSTLMEAAQKLMLLADDGPDWPYAFVCMSNTMLEVSLSNNGHINAMIGSICSINVCCWLHQLQVWKLLQHSDSVVFPEGLNREPEAIQFSFWELPLWNAASTDGPTWDLPMIEVVLTSAESDTASLTQVPPSFQLSNLHMSSPCSSTYISVGALEWLQQTFPVTSAPLSLHSMPGRKLLSADAPLSTRAEDPLGLEGMELAIPDPMATSSQVSPGEVTPEHAPNIVQVSHSPLHLWYQKLCKWPASFPIHSYESPRSIQPGCLVRCFDCKGWTWPWSGCSPLKPPWTPAEGSWCGMPKLPHVEMRPSKRQTLTCSCD